MCKYFRGMIFNEIKIGMDVSRLLNRLFNFYAYNSLLIDTNPKLVLPPPPHAIVVTDLTNPK